MLRQDIIDVIGRMYYTHTITSEEGEFFYDKEFRSKGLDWDSIKIKNSFRDKDSYYKNLDIRFFKAQNNISICVETKMDYKQSEKDFNKAKEQLNAYMSYEKEFTGGLVVGILANTTNNDIIMYKDCVDDKNILPFKEIVSFETISKHLIPSTINNKEKVMASTYKLNELLNGYGISEKIRSQFVGTCLLALKNNLDYVTREGQARNAESIISDIKIILGKLLDFSLNKADKLNLLHKNVLQDEKVRKLKNDEFKEILVFIADNILPFINDETTAGQDLLNLFFTTFNKYVDKGDKNQAFTPDHITEFMCKITGVNKHSRILDPCCGSGAFLVRAMVTALNDCKYEPNKIELEENIKKNQIYGIEYAEKPFGLATTNMLIHGDGNTNIIMKNVFESKEFIRDSKPTVILMNPPYNGKPSDFPKEIIESIKQDIDKNGKVKIDKKTNLPKEIKTLKSYSSESWGKKDGKPITSDPTKGLSFVEFISDTLREYNIVETKLAVLVPLSCAIGSSGLLLKTKENILKYNTLEAVFTMPPELFHPGASVNVCCMLFTMGVPHCKEDGKPKKKTFFGYFKEDGFIKKKNLGRVEQLDNNGESIWKNEIEPKWLELFQEGDVESGLSAKEYVNASDEWLCEAYMMTDYSKLTADDFQQTLNNYLAFLVKEGKLYEA